MILLIFILLIIGLICIPRSKEETEEEKRLDERLQDETIYIPGTGTRLTLEEAEKGLFIAHDNKLRIKTEEEIVRNYSWEQGQVERIRNFAMDSQYRFPSDEVEDKLIAAIGECSFTGRYSDILIYFTIQLSDNLFLTILQVDYQITDGKYITASTEWHLVGAIHRDKVSLEEFPSRFAQKGFNNIENALKDFSGETTIETKGEYMIVKLYRHASLEDAQQMIEVLKKCDS